MPAFLVPCVGESEWEEWAADEGGGATCGEGGRVGVTATAALDLAVNLRTPTFFRETRSYTKDGLAS
jgi:hypothetical protein